MQIVALVRITSPLSPGSKSTHGFPPKHKWTWHTSGSKRSTKCKLSCHLFLTWSDWLMLSLSMENLIKTLSDTNVKQKTLFWCLWDLAMHNFRLLLWMHLKTQTWWSSAGNEGQVANKACLNFDYWTWKTMRENQSEMPMVRPLFPPAPNHPHPPLLLVFLLPCASFPPFSALTHTHTPARMWRPTEPHGPISSSKQLGKWMQMVNFFW